MLPKSAIALLAFTCGARIVSAASPPATYGLYRSTDEGRSWTRTGQDLPATLRIDALGRSSGNLLAGTERGLYVSADEGRHWKRPRQGVPEDDKVLEFASFGGRVYGATGRGVWKSSDDGHTWSPEGPELTKVKVLSLSVLNGMLYAGTDEHGVKILPRSSAGWEDVSQGLPEGAQVFQFTVNEGALFAALYARGAFRFDLLNGRWVPAGEEWPLRLTAAEGILFSGRNPGGVFASRDGGATWDSASQGLPDNAPTWCLSSRGNTVLLGTAGACGLFRFNHTQQRWEPSDGGLVPGDPAITLGRTEGAWFVVTISDRPASGGAGPGPGSNRPPPNHGSSD